MELTDVGFDYNIRGKRFSYINYEFKIGSGGSNDEIASLARSALQDLEQILDSHYTGKMFKKEEGGKITSTRIEYGYDYSNSSILSFFRVGTVLTILRYVIELYSNGNSGNLSLSLHNSDNRTETISAVFDAIISQPDLDISPEAMLQIDRIKSVREADFKLSMYLGLPQPD